MSKIQLTQLLFLSASKLTSLPGCHTRQKKNRHFGTPVRLQHSKVNFCRRLKQHIVLKTFHANQNFILRENALHNRYKETKISQDNT